MRAVLLVGCKLTRHGGRRRLVVASSGSRLGRAPLHIGKRRATVRNVHAQQAEYGNMGCDLCVV